MECIVPSQIAQLVLGKFPLGFKFFFCLTALCFGNATRAENAFQCCDEFSRNVLAILLPGGCVFIMCYHISGYLRDEGLQEAFAVFCKTSQYLTVEYNLLKNGDRPYYLVEHNLNAMLREYGEIKYIGEFVAHFCAISLPSCVVYVMICMTYDCMFVCVCVCCISTVNEAIEDAKKADTEYVEELYRFTSVKDKLRYICRTFNRNGSKCKQRYSSNAGVSTKRG